MFLVIINLFNIKKLNIYHIVYLCIICIMIMTQLNTNDELIIKINNFIKIHELTYDINKIKNVENIVSIINGVFTPLEDPVENLFMAFYKHYERKEYIDAIQYYNKAIDGKEDYAIYNLGCCYNDMGNTEKMKEYFLIAISRGCYYALNDLAYYYNQIGDIDNMMIYYKKAIKLGYSKSMNNLGVYYYKIGNWKKMFKYALMASDKGDIEAMYGVALYYSHINEYDNMFTPLKI